MKSRPGVRKRNGMGRRGHMGSAQLRSIYRGQPMKSLEPDCQRLVIIGGGFAGATLAQRAERLLALSMEVVVVSLENHLVFTPMLPEVAGRSVSPLHIAVPGRSITKRTVWLEADASAVDTKAQVIRYVTSDGRSSEL